jgi:hypothetical protein
MLEKTLYVIALHKNKKKVYIHICLEMSGFCN